MKQTTAAKLCARLPGVRMTPEAGAVQVGGVCDDSRRVVPGDLFIAVRGAAADGAAHVREAVARGAVAVLMEAPADKNQAVRIETAADADPARLFGAAAVPVVLVPDARIARAEVAAAFHGDPARHLNMVGITGTVGKTTVLAMLAGIMDTAGIPAGTIGSLGITWPGATTTTANTTPGPLAIQEALSGMAAAGVRVAAMEVTSHALVQQRVHGLRYDLGIFTNLTMLEHMEYHRSFREYAEAKFRFLQHLKPTAPLIHAAGDRAVRQAARRHPGPRVSCGSGTAWVSVRRDVLSLRGTRMTLTVRRPLPRLDGPGLEPCTFPLTLRTLGRPNISNATLAAAAGLTLGASPDDVREALARIAPPRRRLEVIRDRAPIIIDDTVGHPDSITGVFELAERVPHRSLRVVFCIRGRRGAQINARDAEALAIWSRRTAIDALHITSAIATADERNEVSGSERDAFLDVLRHEAVTHRHHDRLEDAIVAALEGVGEHDLVLLLGAQGMDAGADLVRQILPA